jgi:spermidine synthase
MLKARRLAPWEALVLAGFFLSGSAALVYQVIWARQLENVLGVTPHAIAMVLAAFMGGLALGSFLFGRLVDRGYNGLLLYSLLELGIGIYAVLTPWMFKALPAAHLYFSSASGPSSGADPTMLFLSVMILIVPTTLMGGTLPAMAKFVLGRYEELGGKVGRLYFANTLGAATGAVLAGFFLIARFGLTGTGYLAAATNLAIGAIGLVIYSMVTGSAERRPAIDARDSAGFAGPQETSPYSRYLRALLALSYGVAGLAALGLEVLFTRTLILVVGTSVYAFTLILAGFLVGIALGSYVASAFIDRRKNLWRSFAAVEIAIGIAVIATSAILDRLPHIFRAVFDRFGGSFLATQLLEFGAIFLLLLVPTTLMGAAFPMALKIYTRDLKAVGSDAGALYAWNTAGGVIGPVVVSLFLIPAIGIQAAILAMAFLYLAIGAVLWASSPGIRPVSRIIAPVAAAAVAAFALLTPDWDRLSMTSGVYFHKDSGDGGELLFYKEGRVATVAVYSAGGGANKALVMNGKVEASSVADLNSQLLLGHLGLLWHENPRKVMVVGFGTGISTGAILRHSQVERVDVVELEPVVLEANSHFAAENHRVLQDPRLRVTIDDGRHYALTSRETYDVIAADAFDVWVKGSSNLWTRDTFELYRQRLRSGGIVIQWLPMYAIDPADLRVMVQTFHSVFPHMLIWSTKGGRDGPADLLFMGSLRPLRVDPRAVAEKLRMPEVGDDLARIKVRDLSSLLSFFLMDEEGARPFSQGSFLNTQDHPRLEFSTPRALHRSFRRIADENFDDLWPYLGSPLRLLTDTPDSPTAGQIDAHLKLRRISYRSSASPEEMAAKGELEMDLGLVPRDKESQSQLALFYRTVGLAALKAKRYEEAEKNFRKAAELTGEKQPPRLSQVALSLGKAALEMRNANEAVRQFEIALDLEPDSSEIRSYLAKAQESRAP